MVLTLETFNIAYYGRAYSNSSHLTLLTFAILGTVLTGINIYLLIALIRNPTAVLAITSSGAILVVLLFYIAQGIAFLAFDTQTLNPHRIITVVGLSVFLVAYLFSIITLYRFWYHLLYGDGATPLLAEQLITDNPPRSRVNSVSVF